MSDLQKALEHSEAIPPIAASAKAMLEGSAVPGAVEALDAASEAAVSAVKSIMAVMVPARTEMRLPAEIDTTGANDVTEQLVAFLASLPEHATLHLPELGRLRCEGIVYRLDPLDLLIEGHGTVIVAETNGVGVPAGPVGVRHQWPRTRSHVAFRFGRDVRIRELFVKGPKEFNTPYVKPLEGQHAFEFEGVHGAELDGCGGEGVNGDLLYFGAKNLRDADNNLTPFWTRDVHVHGPGRWVTSGRQTIAATGCAIVLIEDQEFDDTARSFLDIEPHSQWPYGGCLGLTIRGCKIGRSGGTWLANGGRSHAVDRIALLDNIVGRNLQVIQYPGKHVVKNNDGTRTTLWGRRGSYRIERNTSDGASPPLPLMRFGGAVSVTVVGNSGKLRTRTPAVVGIGDVLVHDVRENDFRNPDGEPPVPEILEGDGDSEKSITEFEMPAGAP